MENPSLTFPQSDQTEAQLHGMFLPAANIAKLEVNLTKELYLVSLCEPVNPDSKNVIKMIFI